MLKRNKSLKKGGVADIPDSYDNYWAKVTTPPPRPLTRTSPKKDLTKFNNTLKKLVSDLNTVNTTLTKFVKEFTEFQR